jgi:hypothetical protein
MVPIRWHTYVQTPRAPPGYSGPNDSERGCPLTQQRSSPNRCEIVLQRYLVPFWWEHCCGCGQPRSHHVTSRRQSHSFVKRMRDIDLREIDLKKLRLSRRRLIWLVAGLVVIAGACLGWYYINHPPKPWLVRWRLDRYLSKQAHTGDFKTDFAFPAKTEMAKKKPEAERGPVKGSRTGKDFVTLREEYLTEKTAAVALLGQIKRGEAGLSDTKPKLDALNQQLAAAQAANNEAGVALAQSNSTVLRQQMSVWEKVVARRPELAAKEQALEPVTDDLWEFQRAWIADSGDSGGNAALSKARADLISATDRSLRNASSYEAMYRSIGQELFVAGRLLDSGNPEHRRQGVLIALAAARQSISDVVNGFVAARICEGYVLPHLDLATDRNQRSTFNEDNLLDQCANIFRRNEELHNVVRTYEIALDNARTPAQKDRMRERIARTYEQAGDAKSALATIREIKDTNNYRGLMRRIPQLEQDAKYQ